MKRFLQCCVYSLKFMVRFREHSDNERMRKYVSIVLIPFGIVKYIQLSLKNLLHVKGNNRTQKCAVVVIVKDERRYLEEYFDFYTNMGCDVIVYDNESRDDLKELTEQFDKVIYHWWPGRKRQIDAYNDAVNCYKNKYRYMMFFDADEFLVCDRLFENKKLTEILDEIFERNPKASGIGINWLIFGSSGRKGYPAGGVIDSFLWCSEDEFERNQLVKSIVIPERIAGWVDSHLPSSVMGYHMINMDGKRLVMPRNDLPNDKSIRLYHYFCKNEEYFTEKIKKGFADRIANEKIEMFYYCDKNNIYNDKAMKLKKVMTGAEETVC